MGVITIWIVYERQIEINPKLNPKLNPELKFELDYDRFLHVRTDLILTLGQKHLTNLRCQIRCKARVHIVFAFHKEARGIFMMNLEPKALSISVNVSLFGLFISTVDSCNTKNIALSFSWKQSMYIIMVW